jgi:uncharacterized protein
MKPCLADVNVLLALLVRQHEHHKEARKWFDRLAAGEAGLCRFVQLALIRLLGNHHIMGDDAVPAATAWRLIDELTQDERIAFIPEPDLLDSVLPTLLNSPVPTGKLISDAYLAAFSIAGARRMVTLDRGFRQFKGLDVEVLRGADL